MYAVQSTSKIAMIAAFSFVLTACLEDKNSQNNNEEQAKVAKVEVINNALVISGSNFGEIKKVTISKDNQTINLAFTKKSSKEISATLTSSFNFVAGAVYNLVISTAKADTIFPISIEVPNGHLNPSVLTGANATSGQVLKWNGTAWVPAPDYIGVGSNTFAGYTADTNANLGGLKGGNALCNTAYPGSHWASADEMLRLGPSNPWTTSVWVRNYDDVSWDDNSGVPAYAQQECKGWTSSADVGFLCPNRPGGGALGAAPILTTEGRIEKKCCSKQYALACVY